MTVWGRSLGLSRTIGAGCPSPKICPCRAASLSAKIVHSHAGHYSVYVSVRSTAGFWASSRRCREPSLAAAASRLQEETQTAYADSIGSAVLGRSVAGVERLAPRAGLRSAGYGSALATRTLSQILGPALKTERSSPRKTGRCERNPQTDPADGHRQSPVASSENSWRAQDAGHHHIGANRLTDPADCSTATFSDVEDVSPQSPWTDRIG